MRSLQHQSIKMWRDFDEPKGTFVYLFVLRRTDPCCRSVKILKYFAIIMDTNRDSAHQSQNEDNFATLGLEFLNEAEREKQRERRLGISAVTIRFTEESLLILLSVFRVGFVALFHRLCYKTIGSCFMLCTIELWSTSEAWRTLRGI